MGFRFLRIPRDQDKFKALLCAKAEEIADQVDVILLAQGSMAYAEDAIHEKIVLGVAVGIAHTQNGRQGEQHDQNCHDEQRP